MKQVQRVLNGRILGVMGIILLSCLVLQYAPVLGAKEVLHFVFFNPDNEAKDPITAVSAMKPFTDYMSEDLGYEIQIHYLMRKKDLEKMMKKTKISLAILSPLYVVENKDRLQLEPFAMPYLGNDETYRLIIIAKKTRHFKSLDDLKNKSLAYTALGEENFDFLNKLVFSNKIQVQTHFSKLIEVTSPSSAVMSVLYDQADCACVTSGLYETLKELNPQVTRETEGIFLSPKILRSPMCYLNKNIPQQIKGKIKKIVLEMNKTPLGQQTLMPFKVDGFRDTSIKQFQPMMKMLASTKNAPAKEEKTAAKAIVERIKSTSITPKTSIHITSVKHHYITKTDSVRISAKVLPKKIVKDCELIYKLENQNRTTVKMKLNEKGLWTRDIKLPPVGTKEKVSETVYTVKSGDTLGKISKKYYGEIKKWIMISTYNRLKNPNLILVGQKLRIKLGGKFENILIDVWIKGVDNKEKVVLSPKKNILITR